MKPSLLIRADGHRQMGLGHVMRCLALAEMLRGQFRIRFAIHQPGEALRRRIEASGAELIGLKNPTDAFELTQHLTDDDLVVLDGYAFDETFQRIVRMQCRRLVFIDDLGASQPVADVVINHAGGLSPEEFDADSRTQLCLGPAYALVHPAFVKARRPPGNGILVNLGGADPPNLSRRVVQTLLDARLARPLTVVLGAANPHRASFENLPGITVKTALGVAEMAEEIAACSLAIASFSTVSYEIATVGRPFIGVQIAGNQDRMRRFFETEGLALAALDADFAPKQLLAALQTEREHPGLVQLTQRWQRHFFDGKSPERFRALFQELCFVPV